MNEPVIVIQTALFIRDYNYRVCLTSLLTKYRSYLVHLWSLPYNKQPSLWPLLRQKLYYCVLSLNFTLIYKGKFRKIVSECFLQVFKGFKYYVYKKIVFLMNVVILQPIEPT